MTPLVDSHCHLDYRDFADDLDGVLTRARTAGVGAIVTIATMLSRASASLALAETHADVFCAVGVHPHHAAEKPDVSAAELVRLAKHPKVVAIGECGLDYHYDRSPRVAQAANFRAHIAAARDTGLPVIVHTRDADAETTAVLADEMGKGAFSGVIHCFSSSRELARAAVDLGLYLGIGGILTFRRSEGLRAIVADIPLERLLVETDAPYLAPVPRRGKRNEPAFVTYTARGLAEVKGVLPEVVAETTTANFRRLFSKARITEPERA